MIRMPDGIVTVHLDDERYRGAYYFNGDELVVTAYGLEQGNATWRSWVANVAKRR